jgi:hypothetical protein
MKTKSLCSVLSVVFTLALLFMALPLRCPAADKPTEVEVKGEKEKISGIKSVKLTDDRMVSLRYAKGVAAFPIDKFPKEFLVAWGITDKEIQNNAAEPKPPENRPPDPLDEGQKLLGKGKFEKAIQQFELVIKPDREDEKSNQARQLRRSTYQAWLSALNADEQKLDGEWKRLNDNMNAASNRLWEAKNDRARGCWHPNPTCLSCRSRFNQDDKIIKDTQPIIAQCQADKRSVEQTQAQVRRQLRQVAARKADAGLDDSRVGR